MLSKSARLTQRYIEMSASDLDGIDRIIVSIDDRESRSNLPIWRTLADGRDCRLVNMNSVAGDRFRVEGPGIQTADGSLTDDDHIAEILGNGSVLVDITGMEHAVWASILRVCFDRGINTKFMYVEPGEYKPHLSPSTLGQYDLTVTLNGVAPLPGYAQLGGAENYGRSVFVPMLGFEGNRAECMMITLDPSPKVIPVVGVPGFQIDYPAVTVSCNRDFLDAQGASSDIKMVRASCPFDLISVIDEIATDYSGYYIYLGVIGTKPHALGAALYWLMNKDRSEIIFDHPIKKDGRTTGVGVIHVYDFGEFDVGCR